MSTNALSVYQRIPDTTAAVKQLGQAIAASQLFGCSNTAQGEVLALECLATGEPPLTLAKKNHIIDGKLSMKADAMLAEFNARGGKHTIIERSPARAAVKFEIDKHVYDWCLTWEEAQAEPFVYKGKEGDTIALLAANKKPVLKTKYSTPRSRMQMLWARLISDSVRAIMPGVNFGQYTPEEIDDVDEDEGPRANGNGAVKPAPVDVDQVMRDAAARVNHATDPTQDRPAVVAIIDQPLGEVVDAEFEVKQDGATTAHAPATVTIGGQQHPVVLPTKEQSTIPPVSDEYCTGPQSARINDLFLALEMPLDRQQVNRDKYGGKPTATNRNLTREQADKFIAALEKTRDARAAKLAAEVGGESRMPASVTSAPSTGPCSQAVVDELKSLAKEMEQVKPGSVKAIKEHMTSHGKTRFSDLSAVDAEALRGMLAQRNLEQFFTRSLETWEPVAGTNGNGDGHHGQATEATSEKKVTAA